MKKINVLQVVEALDLGGAGKNVQTTMKYFDKNIFNVLVCVLVAGGRGGQEKKRSKKMWIKLHNVNKSPEKFAELIKKGEIHVAHFMLGEKQFSIFAKAAIKAGALVIILLDSMEKMVDPEISKLFDRHSVSKMCAFRYKKWYKVSNEEFHKNCMVAYLPIDVDEIDGFRISNDEILRRRKKLGT